MMSKSKICLIFILTIFAVQEFEPKGFSTDTSCIMALTNAKQLAETIDGYAHAHSSDNVMLKTYEVDAIVKDIDYFCKECIGAAAIGLAMYKIKHAASEYSSAFAINKYLLALGPNGGRKFDAVSEIIAARERIHQAFLSVKEKVEDLKKQGCH